MMLSGMKLKLMIGLRSTLPYATIMCGKKNTPYTLTSWRFR